MYERNAIVLERYFYDLFGFKNNCNLKENYQNYRDLFECYGTLCSAKEKEIFCQNEFENASKEITKLQTAHEKLYKKSTKFEYSRYVIFSNITEASDDIEKHLNKVGEDAQKNVEELKELGEKFVQAVQDYNEKEANLKEAISAREKAQKTYDKTYDKAKNCYNEITEELIDETKQFIDSDNKENKKELQEVFENNGKKEKNQFDSDVISNTINKSFEIYKIEMDIYLAGYDRISKLLEEIENDSVKVDKHTKYYKDSKAKLDFLNAEKEYIVQFLDNERMGAIYDKKTHRKLMLEACKKFVLDFAQIEKLYDVILKEAAGRSTKKIYKENYNKEYLLELESSSVEPDLDTGKMRQQAIAFVNLNYWRMEGMKSVYDVFEDVVENVYERDLSEFIPETVKEPEEIIDQETEEQKDIIVQETEKLEEVVEETEAVKAEEEVSDLKKYHSSKVVLANAIYRSLQKREFAEESETIEETQDSQDEKVYAVPEEVKAILANAEQAEQLENAEVEETVEENVSDAIEETVAEEIAEPEEISETVEEAVVEETEPEEEAITFDLSKLDEIDDIEDIEEVKPAKAESKPAKIELVEEKTKEKTESIIETIEENIEPIAEVEDEEIEESVEPIIEMADEKVKPIVKEAASKNEKYQTIADETIDDEDVEDDDEDEEDSILEIYFNESDDEKEESDSTANNLGKKVGLFQKLVGFNSKKKREA